MIVDMEREATLPQFDAEVCIVGAGAAGLVLAAELVRQGKRVLLLESGGAVIEPEAQELNSGYYAGQSRRSAHLGRFRSLGGTTTMWGGQILEFTEEDFAARPWVPGSGWPFPKREMQPYYERALLAEGLASVLRKDDEVWHRMKTDVPALGSEMEAYLTRWCPEPNFARLYAKLLQSPQLLVVLHATATAMMFTEDKTRVAGFRCRSEAGREVVFSAEQHVLCLGTIETVRFLLQPLSSAHVAPWNESGLLGRHFQSHIDYDAAQISTEDAFRMRHSFANLYLQGQKYHPKFRLAAKAQRQEEILNIAGSVTCINSAEEELRRVKLLARNLLQGRNSGAKLEDLPRVMRLLPKLLGLGYGYGVQHRAYWPKDSTFWLRVHCEQDPLSSSSITLTDIRDANGLLRARLDWHVSLLEWQTIRRFTSYAQRAFRSLGSIHIHAKPELAQDDGFASVVFDDSHHDMGGARMAESPNEGVVDPNLKLHGLENAYVCSGSVFPTGGFSNPTHTLIALAIRLADHLAGRAYISAPAGEEDRHA